MNLPQALHTTLVNGPRPDTYACLTNRILNRRRWFRTTLRALALLASLMAFQPAGATWCPCFTKCFGINDPQFRRICEGECYNDCALGKAGTQQGAPGSAAPRPPSPLFGALRRGDLAVFDSVPAYRARLYVGAALTAVSKECKSAKGRRPDSVVDAASYFVEPPNRRHELGGAFLFYGITQADAAFMAEHDGANDVRWLVGNSGCDADALAWVAHVNRFLAEPAHAGPFPLARKVCDSGGLGIPREGCDCFARSFDMESTPARRRSILGAADPQRALPLTFQDRDFTMRVTYKCSSEPRRPSASELVTTERDPGGYGVPIEERTYYLVGRDRNGYPYQGTCEVVRKGKNRYQMVKAINGVRMEGIGLVSGTTLTFHGPQPDPMTYAIRDDGSLHAKREGGAWESIQTQQPGTAARQQPSPGAAAAQAQRDQRQAATMAKYCGNLAAAAAHVRDAAARRPSVQAESQAQRLERAYQERCGKQP